MKTGYIKIFRSIEDWEWIDEPVMFYFWGRILLMANWDDRRWHGEVVERGSFITSLSGLSEKLGLSVKQVRTCLRRLEMGKEIVTEGASKGTKVTICKYDYYQGYEAGEWQAKGTMEGKQKATTKEEYNYNTSDTNVSSYSNSIQEEKKKKDEDTVVSSQKDSPPDFSFVLDLWNSSAKRSVPKIRSLSPARKEKVRLRIKEMGGMEKARETLAECFKKISESDFCNGATGKWVATFDWFFDNEKNWLKVYEGNYDNRKPQSRIQQYADTANRFNALMDELYGPDDNGTANGAGYTPDEQ